MEEFCKMFTEAESFYYSDEFDLTNSIQRQSLSSLKMSDTEKLPLCYAADLRFFWNHYMLSDLIQAPVSSELQFF